MEEFEGEISDQGPVSLVVDDCHLYSMVPVCPLGSPVLVNAAGLSPKQMVCVPEMVPPAVGLVQQVVTVTVLEASLSHFPEAVAFAVIKSPAARVKPLFVQAPLFTMVLPCEMAFLNTSILVPSASVLVPLIEVAPAHKGEVVIDGAAVMSCTVTVTSAQVVMLQSPS